MAMRTIARSAVLATLVALTNGGLWAQPNPYLQTPTPTSVYISWHSADTSFTLVRFGLSEAALDQVTGGSFQNISGKLWHTVQLTGLSPSTRYYYRCISGTDSSAVYPFRTQPQGTGPGLHVRFVLIGDTRDNDTIPTYLPVVCQYLEQTLVSKYGSDWFDSVNLVMHTGDIVWNGNDVDRYQNEFFTPISTLSCSVPVMVAIGNHERESPLYYDYMKYTDFTDSIVRPTMYNKRFYSFNIANCQFLVLNTNKDLLSAPLQITWLNKMLTISDTSPATGLVFPFSHHPWRSSVWPRGNNDSVMIKLFPIFNNYYKISQYSYGHTHDYEHGVYMTDRPDTTNAHDMRLVLSGGGGAELSRYGTNSRNYPEIFKAIDDYSYVIVDVDANDRSYTEEVYTLGKPEHFIDNQLLDSMHFRMDQPPPATPEAFEVGGGSPVVLNSSAISGLDSCMSARIQVTTTPGDYTYPVIDTLRNWENFFGNTEAPYFTPINRNEGINLYSFTVPNGKLLPSAIHGFRVRYRDMNLKWSGWSDEKLFLSSGINESSPLSSRDVILRQNHPNPFTGETVITVDLKTGQQVRLLLLDSDGREICCLMEKELPPGSFEILFSAIRHNISPGIYYLRLLGRNAVATISMTLIP